MKTQYSFSPSQTLFYANALRESTYEPAGTWPADAFDIDDEIMMEYTSAPPAGKILATVDGMPGWIDAPEPTHEELVSQATSQKDALRSQADYVIAPLQDAVDLDMATTEEAARLTAWKKYRVLLSRIDPNQAPNITWPTKPE